MLGKREIARNADPSTFIFLWARRTNQPLGWPNGDWDRYEHKRDLAPSGQEHPNLGPSSNHATSIPWGKPRHGCELTLQTTRRFGCMDVQKLAFNNPLDPKLR